MPDYSDNLKVNVNRLDSIESLKVLIEITHPLLPEPVRVINDNCDMVSKGNNFIAFPFEFQRAPDVENELPKAQLVFSNVGRSFVRWIEESYGASDADLKIIFARRSEPDTWENEFPCKIISTNLTPELITIDLVILANKLIQRGIRFTFDTNRTPGLF
jgi:hypothetical protein